MSIQSPSRLWFYGVFYLTLLILLSCWIYQQNQAVIIVAPTLTSALDSHRPLQCVSYAPYYGKNQSPFVVGIKLVLRKLMLI